MGCITTTSSDVDTEIKGTVTEVINQYLTIKWMYQRRIVVYQISGPLVMHEATETWYTNVKRIIAEWPIQVPYLAIQDATNANFSITPYLVACIRELYAMRPELPRRIGVVTPRTIAAQLLKVLVRSNEHAASQTRLFFTRGEAVNWLLKESETRPL